MRIVDASVYLISFKFWDLILNKYNENCKRWMQV